MLPPCLGYDEFRQVDCAPLNAVLERRTGEIYTEAEYRRHLEAVSARAVREAAFALFFKEGRAESQQLSDWCDKVKERAKKAVAEGKVGEKDFTNPAGNRADTPGGEQP